MMMILRITCVENNDILEPLVQVSLIIIKIKIRNFTRRKEKASKVVEPISHEKKRMRAHPLILVQVWTMSVSTYV